MRITQGIREINIEDKNVPLVTELLTKWGFPVEKNIAVTDLNTVLAELKAWDIPWTWK